MADIKISVESPRLTLNALHTLDDVEGLRQTLALLQTFIRSTVGETDSSPSRPPRTPRRPKGDASEK